MTRITNYKELNGIDTAPSVVSAVPEKIEHKNTILKYLRSFNEDCVSAGKVFDEIENKQVDIALISYTDGEFYWNEADIYYFENYDLKLEDDFVQKVLKN